MKLLILVFCPLFLYGQVGVNTSEPQAMLDVNGDVRIGEIQHGSELAARDSILVVNGNRVVHIVAAEEVFKNTPKSLVKGRIIGNPTSPDNRIPFNSIDFDVKGEYDSDTYEFVAQDSGIYRVGVQFALSGAITANVDLGLLIYKVDAQANEELIAQSRYMNLYINIALLQLAVSPPIRQTSTLVSLLSGEKLIFRKTSALSINLLSKNSEDTFFTIEQVY